jgi:hypothetical protein
MINIIKRHKINLPKKPDDFFQMGPLSFVRYGKYIIAKNQRTPEQQEAFTLKAAERYPYVCKDIDEHVARIRSIVQEFDPLRLLQCAYFKCVQSMLGKTSESEYGRESIILARMLDYVQSVIVSSPGSYKADKSFDDNIWKMLHKEVSALYNILDIEYIVCRSSYLQANQKDYDYEYDKFYVIAEKIWLHVRCDRYFIHDMPHLRDLLTPHNEIFKELFCISVELFLDSIEKIQRSLSRGLTEVVEELLKLHEMWLKTAETTKDDEFQLFIHKFQCDHANEMQSIKDRFDDYDLFDLQIITELPVSILRELSWRPGENSEFFAQGEFAGWPLRLLPVRVRPFLCINDRYYCFDLVTLMDELYRTIQKLIIRLKPDYIENWNVIQKSISEDIPFKLFGKLLPSAKYYRNVYYQWVSGHSSHREWCETDGLIIYDDHLIILEIKGGAFTYTPPTSDFNGYIRSVGELIRKPAEQVKRFIDYLNSYDEVTLYDRSHHPIGNIRKSQFRIITPCCVTLDSFTDLAARTNKLHELGVSLPIPIWSISVDDLRAYADVIDIPVIFAHFLEQRQNATIDPHFEVYDELDHLGLYLRYNFYTCHAREMGTSVNTDHLNWHGFRYEIDTYFHNLFANPDHAENPLRKEIKGYLYDVVRLLSSKEKRNKCKAGSNLLNMDGDARRQFNQVINDTLHKQKQKNRIMPISFIGNTKSLLSKIN